MSQEIQKAAIIIAQAALLNARIAQMQAANAARERGGWAPAYGEDAFDEEIRAHPLLDQGNAARFMAD